MIALVCGITASSGMALLTTLGLGTHDGLMASNCVYLTCNAFVKLGLLEMYRQFTMLCYNHWWISGMEVLSVIFALSGVVGVIFQCVPVTSAWNPNIIGHCLNKPAFWYSNGAIMIVLDTVLYIMPMVFTWNLQLPLRQKICLRLLFALGFLTIIASSMRLYLINRTMIEGDSPYNNGHMLIWAAVENHSAICIACAPAIRIMVVKTLIPAIQDYYSSSRSRFSRRSTAVGSANSGKCPALPRDSFIALTDSSKRDSTMNSRYHTRVKPWSWFLTLRSKPANHDIDLECNGSLPCPHAHVSSATHDAEPSPRASTIEKEDDKIYVKNDFKSKETFLVSMTVDVDRDADEQMEREYINAFPRPGPEDVDPQRSYMNSIRLLRARHDRGLNNMST
ncbi:hypothetical protein FKW77_008650 [Venturia effusa]|uniref:Rhodopsin domain-containing protein n=1 Tax=Venturia effusa TaxID=50376 RepID=A0A517L3W8_9PEZI|nr:hypothetical protein FKW77_008650 [Venturia effusa]